MVVEDALSGNIAVNYGRMDVDEPCFHYPVGSSTNSSMEITVTVVS